jgi:hypothetical protein
LIRILLGKPTDFPKEIFFDLEKQMAAFDLDACDKGLKQSRTVEPQQNRCSGIRVNDDSESNATEERELQRAKHFQRCWSECSILMDGNERRQLF